MYLCHTCSIYDYALQQLTCQLHSLLNWLVRSNTFSVFRQFSSAGNILIPIALVLNKLSSNSPYQTDHTLIPSHHPSHQMANIALVPPPRYQHTRCFHFFLPPNSSLYCMVSPWQHQRILLQRREAACWLTRSVFFFQIDKFSFYFFGGSGLGQASQQVQNWGREPLRFLLASSQRTAIFHYSSIAPSSISIAIAACVFMTPNKSPLYITYYIVWGDVGVVLISKN